MRRAISQKLHSQRGASLLLALLFLLVCSMVAASILMAAAANAGKYRSNLEEHQTYLALSSAVTTLCDELNRPEYKGQYQYREETEKKENSDGTITFITHKYFKQLDGSYTHIDTVEEPGYLKDILLNDFDALFAAGISLPSDVTNEGLKTNTITPHQLTLTPSTGTSLDGRTVKLTLEVKDSYAIYITAYLEDLEVYKVEAELTPTETKPTIQSLTPGTHFTQPMRWKLGWITIAGETTEGEGTDG